MIVRILRNDLRRKKTMNIVLFLFIMLSAVFVASGLNNVCAVVNGIDAYLDKANVGDFVIITMGNDTEGTLDWMLETEPAVKAYRMERAVYGGQDCVTAEDGSGLETKNTLLFQSVEECAITLFDKDNEAITQVPRGHVFVNGRFMEQNQLQEGDVICIEHCGARLSLVLDGNMKDALLGSELMGNTRFLLNDEDMGTLLQEEEIRQYYQGRICYIETDDVSAVSSAMAKVSNVMFDGSRATLKMCYVMDMIVAFIMLLLSVCLMIVSFVVLKFSITFTITEEYREIGVMKAIGLSNARIRGLYLVKYLMMALAGVLFGFFLSIPFGNLLLASVSKNMALGNDNAFLVNLLGCVLVVGVIVSFAYLCTGRVKRATPVDAIRSGQTGERYKNKSALRLGRWKGGSAFFLAANDLLSNLKRYLTVIVSLGLCTLFVLVLANTVATMKSDRLIGTFGTKSHLYMTDVSAVMEARSRGEMENRLEEMEQELDGEGMPAQLCIEMQYKYAVTFLGKDYVLTCQQGIHTKSSDYQYTEGVIPQNEREIAITPQIAEILGAKIGDTVTVHYGREDLECIITAYFQTMNQLGEIIRLHEDAPAEFDAVSSSMSYQINFTDDPSEEEIEERKARIKKLYGNDKVMNAAEYCEDCTGVAGTLESVQRLLLAITLVVVTLVAVLMERSFIADEKGQIAILKAVGFGDRAVIRWHVYRLGLAALLAGLLAAALSVPVTRLCITPIFGMMGATDVDYYIEPLRIFLLYPGIVLAATVFVTWITALYTKTITSRDTASIE